MNNKPSSDVYEMIDVHDIEEKHTIAVLVDNDFGVLARVVGLFSARGYNLESLTVSEVDKEKNLSRITIITYGSEAIIEQIRALLERLIPVYEVCDLTVESPHIEREVALIKVVGDEDQHIGAMKLADRFGARTIDSTPTSFVFELSDIPEKIDKFIDRMEAFGIKEVCRSGVTAISRGTKSLTIDEI